MTTAPPLSLTDDHVRRATRQIVGARHRLEWHLLEDRDLDAIAARLTRGRQRPIPIFAYGSLIWNPDFAVHRRTRATALGWHRQFNISLDHFRGSPAQLGLMLALARGGRCEGLVLEIAPGTERESLRSILRRELVAHELSRNASWIEVETAQGRSEALTFYAGPVDTDLADLTIAEQAMRLARACGPAGSGAEYLLRTARGLREAGIVDPYIWELQARVAAEIDSWTGQPE
ncbi:gamma-glutamylcyclotransferase [Paracoccus sediminicola]|uniref:gamma-glutamylcyclotransferase n=1 Tax=Paracoccus sediminicola TaxID=3017783 RepID=UPI0022F061C0|nr:gamma-glutamylcyclotransferase [Paracoccus sediminicola]WBU57996.1 gamma-glutamylcyclotransferase [Paracoccus sediminicola]